MFNAAETPPVHAGSQRLKGLLAGGPVVMGVLNVTPDSFSDGGQHLRPQQAVMRARQMVDEGAAILDIGGESTRPGAEAVPLQVELDRVIPVIERVRAELDVLVSIDTMKPEVMRAACHAGAGLINDVNALQTPGALDVAIATQSAVCLMHMQGAPRTMQKAPVYADVNAEVSAFLAARVSACREAGIPDGAILVDPGIGFGKQLEHNLALLANMQCLAKLGAGVLVGVSRKSMFGHLLGADLNERLPGGLAVSALAVWQGVSVNRVHDVAETVQAVRTALAIRHYRRSGD